MHDHPLPTAPLAPRGEGSISLALGLRGGQLRIITLRRRFARRDAVTAAALVSSGPLSGLLLSTEICRFALTDAQG